MRDLKKGRAKAATQTKVNLRKAGIRGRVAAITKARNPFRNG